MVCKFCGNTIEDNSEFCFICGNKVIKDEIPAEAVYAQPAPAEIPVGILMAFVGAPFFFVLLLRRGKESSHASN